MSLSVSIGNWIGCACLGNRNSTWIGVFDDCHRRLGEVIRCSKCSIDVHIVVVGHLFAAEQLRLRNTAAG